MKNFLKFTAGALLGALMGGIVVTLLAPGSGDETRLAFSEKLNLLRNQIMEAMNEKRSELETELSEYQKM
jgi:gas vesicle protein